MRTVQCYLQEDTFLGINETG